MNRMNISYLLLGAFLFCMLAGVAAAAGAGGSSGSNGAALQVSSHTTIPDTVYTGSVGQLQLTITNSGTDTAAATVIDYQPPGQSQPSEFNIGDIGAGSSAIASIPFTVPENVSSGFFVMNLNVVYFGDTTKTTIKNTPVTIPLAVSQHQILNVKTLSVEPQSVQPGDGVSIQLEVDNTGGVMKNAVISTDGDSTFTLSGASQQTIGDIQSGGNKTVSVSLVSSSTAAVGKYNFPLVITYQDLQGNNVNQTVLVGPVSVSEPSTQFMVTMVPVTPAEVGSEAQFTLTLTNLADSSISATVDLNDESPFTPIGSSRAFFNDIAPGKSATQTIIVGIAAGTTSGYYNFPLTITSNGREYNQSMGLKVVATSDLDVTATTTPEFVSAGSNGVHITAQIANIGNGPMRSVYVSANSTKDFQVVGTADKFIGTLNIDDFTTFPVTVTVSPSLAPGDYVLPIAITFKDANNQQQTIVKDLAITIYSAQDAGRLGMLSGSSTTTGTTGTTTSTSGFSGRQAGLFGIPYTWIIGAAVLLVVGYFGYKRFKGNKK